MKNVTKVKLSRQGHQFMFFDDLEKLIFTNRRGTQAIVYDLTTKKNERLYNFGRDFVTFGMKSSDFFSVSGVFKTFVCKISDDLYYECPRDDLFCWNVYEDRYFVFYTSQTKEHKSKLYCCDSYNGNFTEIGDLTVRDYWGLYYSEKDSIRTFYKGSDKLNTTKMCLEFDLKELKFEGLKNGDFSHVYNMADHYVVLLERETKNSTSKQIHIFDENCLLIRKIHFISIDKYVQVSTSSDGQTINVVGESMIKRFDIFTGELTHESNPPAGYSFALYGDFYKLLFEGYPDNSNFALYDLRTMNYKEFNGSCSPDKTREHVHCLSENKKEIIRISHLI